MKWFDQIYAPDAFLERNPLEPPPPPLCAVLWCGVIRSSHLRLTACTPPDDPHVSPAYHGMQPEDMRSVDSPGETQLYFMGFSGL